MNQSESHKTTGTLLPSPSSARLISGSTTHPHESDDTSQSTTTTTDDDDDSFVHVMNDNNDNDNPSSSSSSSSEVLIQSTNENTNEISTHPFAYTTNDIEEDDNTNDDGYVAIVTDSIKQQQTNHPSHPNQNQLERNSQNGTGDPANNNNNNNNDPHNNDPHQQTSRSNSNTNTNNNILTTNRLTCFERHRAWQLLLPYKSSDGDDDDYESLRDSINNRQQQEQRRQLLPTITTTASEQLLTSNEVTLPPPPPPPPRTLKRTKSYLPEPSSSSRGVTFISARLKKIRIDHITSVSTTTTTTSTSRQQQQLQQRLASINNNNECNAMNRILQTSSSSRRNCNAFVPYGSNDTTRNQSTTHHMHHHHLKRYHNTNNIKNSNKQQPQPQQQQTTTTANQQHTTNAQKRLLHDFHRLQTDPPTDILAVPADTNILQWDGIIFGPPNSPWEGGIFKLTLTFTEAYPYTPPTVRFLTKIFHPNIDPDGGTIGLTILEEDWNPVYDVMAILISIQSILCHPLVVSPRSRYYGSDEAQMLFVEDRMEYDRRVRMMVVEQLELEQQLQQQQQQNLCF